MPYMAIHDTWDTYMGHMQVCTSLQTDNHTSTPPLSFYRPDGFPAAQPTASKWNQGTWTTQEDWS